jgi:hypothetical protein
MVATKATADQEAFVSIWLKMFETSPLMAIEICAGMPTISVGGCGS